jgi:hypothetical protein
MDGGGISDDATWVTCGIRIEYAKRDHRTQGDDRLAASIYGLLGMVGGGHSFGGICHRGIGLYVTIVETEEFLPWAKFPDQTFLIDSLPSLKSQIAGARGGFFCTWRMIHNARDVVGTTPTLF